MRISEDGGIEFDSAEAEAALQAIGTAAGPSPTCSFLSTALAEGSSHDRDLLFAHMSACRSCASKVAKHYRSGGSAGGAA
ncbi:MAG TPA: hypothetical protein VJM32_06630 [Candidatus Saccharimonadales bacterium]|nr:hypothetical protein [Candidatus Saccharimonadales bacterium]